MPKPEWGVKRVCPTTGKRFYDMNRDPIVSPYSGEVVQIDTGASKPATVGARAASAPTKSTAKPQAEDPLIEDDDTPDVEADLLEDDDDDSVSLDELADVAEKDDES